MPDNDTLLAYLVSSFPGNTEDIATEALRHIFDHSDACGVALNDVIQSGVRGVNAITPHTSGPLRQGVQRPAGRGHLAVSAQLRALKDYAKANGYSVAREYVDEAESGRVADRPQFREMIDEGSQPKASFEVILIRQTQ